MRGRLNEPARPNRVPAPAHSPDSGFGRDRAGGWGEPALAAGPFDLGGSRRRDPCTLLRHALPAVGPISAGTPIAAAPHGLPRPGLPVRRHAGPRAAGPRPCAARGRPLPSTLPKANQPQFSANAREPHQPGVMSCGGPPGPSSPAGAFADRDLSRRAWRYLRCSARIRSRLSR